MDKEFIAYAAGVLFGSVLPLVPGVITRFSMPMILAYVVLYMSYMGYVFTITKKENKKYFFYLPFLLIFAGLVSNDKPRLGILMLSVSIFLLGTLLVNNIVLKEGQKIFQNDFQEHIVVFEILLLCAISLKFLNQSLGFFNIKRNLMKAN